MARGTRDGALYSVGSVASIVRCGTMGPRVCLPVLLFLSSLDCGSAVMSSAPPPPLPPRSETDLHLHVLDKAVGAGTLDARCLDGSPMAYWIRPASAAENSSKFVVYFQGGGWCAPPARLPAVLYAT